VFYYCNEFTYILHIKVHHKYEVIGLENTKENKNKDSGKLRNYSQVMSDERLADPDVQVEGGMTAGGDRDYLLKDIEDREEENS
jgi:hypothetical protein